jgi:molybdopterin molybdotransferase
VVLTSGGVSMGAEFDPLRAALAAHPVEFWQVAIKPAKHFAFGTIGPAIYAGLPGNPVSVVVSFELFVRPLLERLRGLDTHTARLSHGRAEHPIELPADDRTHLVPVRRTASGTWSSTELVGSHALAGVASADAFALLGPDERHVEAGGPLALLPLWT